MKTLGNSRRLGALFPLLCLTVFPTCHAAFAETPPLIAAIMSGDSATTDALLRANSSIDARDVDGNTALHWAAIRGRDALVRELIRRGATVDATNRLEATPLIHAVAHAASVRALVEAGADVNHASRSEHGPGIRSTPLLAAVLTGDSREVVDLLLKAGADASPSPALKNGAAGPAAVFGDRTTIDRLLVAGAKPADLWTAVASGDVEIVRRFLDGGADINATNAGVGSALNAALIWQQPEVARFLLERGASMNHRAPANRAAHDTPSIVLAAYSQSGDTTVASMMIERGVDLNAASSRGETALDWARGNGNQELERILRQAGGREGTYHQLEKRIPQNELPGDTASLDSWIRSSAAKAIRLLQSSSDAYFRSGGSVRGNARCDSCHHQYHPAMAYGMALRRGIPVDRVSLARQIQNQIRQSLEDDTVLKCYERVQPFPVPANLMGYGLIGLREIGWPADRMTDAFSWYLAGRQRLDGSWRDLVFRPPIQDGPIPDTALVIRVLRSYPVAGHGAEFSGRIRRARDFLASAKTVSLNQQVFQLLGLGWAGDRPADLAPLVRGLVGLQATNGGWAQLPGLPEDAYATGQALYALHTVGGMATSDSVFQRGVRFLLRTQFEDGSWFVRSRAWPIQPHFESGFPHGKNQWISAAGTTWAVMALLCTQPEVAGLPAVDWMAIQVPGLEPEVGAEATAVASSTAGTRSVDFLRDIRPVLERSCVGCHSGERAKGGLRIDSRTALLKGGHSGASLVPGRPPDTLLLQFAKGEVEDLEMPPLGKRAKYPGLSSEEIRRVEAWIREGAAWPEGVTLNPPDR